MKKIFYFVTVVFLFHTLNSCTGYEPIYGNQNTNIKIVKHYTEGNKVLAQKIYSELNKIIIIRETEDFREVSAKIFVKKNKLATSKDSTGKVLSYKIILDVELIMVDIYSDEVLLSENITLSDSYKVRSQGYLTDEVEEKIMSNLIIKSSEEFLLKISQATIAE